MKKLLCAALMAPAVVFAKPVSFDFAGVPLVAFSQATFKSIMGRDYVIAPEVLAADRKITISVKNIDSEAVPAFVENILAEQGVAVTERNGVYYLSLASRQQAAIQGAQSPVDRAQAMYGVPMFPTPVSSSRVPSLATDEAVQMESKKGAYTRRADDESAVYVPRNRPSDFLASVVNAAFGSNSAMVAGARLVLTGAKVDLDKMAILLESLDMLPKKVDVAASWVEVTRTDGSNQGISLIANVLGTKLGVSVGAVNTATAVSLKNANFELVIDALSTDGRFNQVSNSRVIGDEYEKINLTVGDETPTVSSSGKDNSGNLIQNIVYRPSGVIIDVLPKVLGSGRINMAIDGQISSFKSTQTGVSGSPTLIKRQVKTNVTVADGEVLLIGGLNESKDANTRSGLRFLPKAWSLENESTSNTDLVLILSAQVAK